MMKVEKNYLSRVLALLLLTFLFCSLFYFLPEKIFGYSVKRVDLLSDIRVKKESLVMDSLRMQLSQVDSTFLADSLEMEEEKKNTKLDSIKLAISDSLYRQMAMVQGADSSGKHIEDYSQGHVALQKFFTALRNRDKLGRPVRVAFLGDSFIEGDIIVGDFRSALQKMFGGHGVGFVPVDAVAAQYRPTVKQESSGWRTWSMLTDHSQKYTLSGLTFVPDSTAKQSVLSLKATGYYPELASVSSLKLLYEKNTHTRMQLFCNGGIDSVSVILPPTDHLTQYEYVGNIEDARFVLSEAQGFKLLGAAMEDNEGIVVDNFSLRGNSGIVMQRIDSLLCRDLAAVRPYDLIILQYGLNVASEGLLQYGWYAQKMVNVIRHIQNCFPEADVLLLGVSDRGQQIDGRFETMPAVLALLNTQRQVARKTKIAFWNTFGAMGGENSIVRFVKNNWASKDYTHVSFRGGREIARVLFDALMKEKEFYDEVDEKMAGQM